MVDPVDVKQIATAALTSGAIVFFGAMYSIFYALAQLRGRIDFMLMAHLSYAVLASSTIFLAFTLSFTGVWLVLAVTLLVGYFIAPRFIWKLSVAVHEPDQASAHAAPSTSDHTNKRDLI